MRNKLQCSNETGLFAQPYFHISSELDDTCHVEAAPEAIPKKLFEHFYVTAQIIERVQRLMISAMTHHGHDDISFVSMRCYLQKYISLPLYKILNWTFGCLCFIFHVDSYHFILRRNVWLTRQELIGLGGRHLQLFITLLLCCG